MNPPAVPPPSRPHRFRGALTFNQRTVGGALDTLLQRHADGGSARGTALPLAELVNVLLLLESLAMSNGIFLDGTLPPKDVDALKDSGARLRLQCGVDVGLKFIKARAAKLQSLFKDAAETAALLIDSHLAALDAQPDKPMKEDISEFVRRLVDGEADKSGRARTETAREIADAAAKGIDKFRGSKCVAGLLIAESEAVPVLQRAASVLRGASEATQRKAVAVLITRFRINYLNSLAMLRDAAYLADLSIEDHKAAQVVLFCRYLAQKISNAHVKELSEETRRLFDESISLAPLGFAILMNSQAKFPADLLSEAFALRDRRFCRAAADESPQTRFLHEMTADQFSDFRDYLFKARWSALVDEQARGEYEHAPMRRLQIPTAAGGVVGAVVGTILSGPGAALAGPAGAGLGALIGHVLTQLSAEAAEGRLGKRRLHVDQYRRMDAYVHHAMEKDGLRQTLAEKVETVFGRALAIGRA